ncbi:hypothetical protein NDU88_002507 [Pleurodeles waltl]|uniref:Uncharacterized protein n=1 Tax=Pleurodeles waltl TaxID=8319 RepID=A0AAV7UZX8_PLEWA|nr:hypothetical protein NDU88_002507 [Pleurodeles waltl]
MVERAGGPDPGAEKQQTLHAEDPVGPVRTELKAGGPAWGAGIVDRESERKSCSLRTGEMKLAPPTPCG